MKQHTLFIAASFVILLASCTTKRIATEEIIDAIRESRNQADKDGVSRTDYQVTSAVRLFNGMVDFPDGKEAIAKELADKLKHRTYWQICYTTTHELMVARTYCYFIEKGSNNLLATFHMK